MSESWLEARLIPVAERAGRQPHLLAIRDGVVGALPLVLIGSLFLLVAQPPVEAWQKAIAASPRLLPALLAPFQLTTGLIAIYVCFSTAHSLARHYQLDPLATGLASLAALMVTSTPVKLSAGPGTSPEWMLPIARLGSGGLFVGIILSLAGVELFRLFEGKRWVIRLPEGVPPSVIRSFSSLLPGLALVVLTWAVVHLAGFDPYQAVLALLRPVLAAGDSLVGVLLVVLIDSLVWLVGIHPVALLAGLGSVWLQMITENGAAAAQGLAPPHIAPREFFIWFVWLGGSGGVLLVPFLLLRARSRALRALAKISAPAVLFNINEPLLFGAPVVMNPALAPPFLLAPLVSAILAWLAFHANLLSRPILVVPWTLPAPVGALLSTGGDFRAVALMGVNLAISTLIYLPFLRAYDRRLAGLEEGEMKGER